MAIQRITPFLWFDQEAEQAATFYVSIFPNSKIVKTARYSDARPGPAGSVMTIEFQLDGQTFVGLNGGRTFKFTEAVSFVVNCQTQDEVDYYWDRLAAGGVEVQCGWLKDKFGLSWQIVPSILPQLLGGPDRARSALAMKAMLGMKKLDTRELQRAYDNG